MNTKVKVILIIVVIGLLTVGAGFGTSYLIDKSSNASTTISASKEADTKKVSNKKSDKKSDEKSEEKDDKKESSKETKDIEKKDETKKETKTTTDTNKKTNTSTNQTSNKTQDDGIPRDEYGRALWDNGHPIAYTADGRNYNPDTERVLPSGDICPLNYIEVGEPMPYPEWVDNGDSIEVCYSQANTTVWQKAQMEIMNRYFSGDPSTYTYVSSSETVDTGYIQMDPGPGLAYHVYKSRIWVVPK